MITAARARLAGWIAPTAPRSVSTPQVTALANRVESGDLGMRELAELVVLTAAAEQALEHCEDGAGADPLFVAVTWEPVARQIRHLLQVSRS